MALTRILVDRSLRLAHVSHRRRCLNILFQGVRHVRWYIFGVCELV